MDFSVRVSVHLTSQENVRLTAKSAKFAKKIAAIRCVLCDYIKSLPQRLRTRMTRIGRMYTDTISVHTHVVHAIRC